MNLRILALGFAAAGLLANPAHANLLTNGDFETADLSPWSQSFPAVAVVSGEGYNSTYAARLGVQTQIGPWTIVIGTGEMVQPVSLLSGQTYDISYVAKTSGEGGTGLTGQHLAVRLGNSIFTPFIVSDIDPTTQYEPFSASFTAPATGIFDLRLGWGDGPNFAFVDDVALTARGASQGVPDGGGSAMLLSTALAGLAGWRGLLGRKAQDK